MTTRTPHGSGGLQVPPGFRDSPARALDAGEVVASTYQIRDQIAHTETGVVFEARDLLLDRLVALKLAWRNPGTPPLLPEAKRCAAVRDPCAVAIYGMGAHHGVEYVAGERVTGVLLHERLRQRLAHDAYLTTLRALFAAVHRAHEAGIAIGDISGATINIDDAGRMVLGRLSLSQVPAFGPIGRILAPEVVRGHVEAGDPAAAEAIDLYGLGCVAIELAHGTPPFVAASSATLANVDHALLQGHAFAPPPRLDELRPDLPGELADLVDWLLAKDPAARPRSAGDVLAQLEAIIARLGTKHRTLRILVVDDDTARARWLWSLARRADASAIVEIASEGTDAAHKLNRDQPDLVFVDAGLKGVMNALELCMYARGLEDAHRAQLVVIGDVNDRDRALFDDATPLVRDDADLAYEILDRVRQLAAQPAPRRKSRSTISG